MRKKKMLIICRFRFVTSWQEFCNLINIENVALRKGVNLPLFLHVENSIEVNGDNFLYKMKHKEN